MNHRVIVSNAHGAHRLQKRNVSDYVRRVLREEGAGPAAISVVLVGTRFIRRINRKFLGHDVATDVISFPLESGKDLEGEVYVNLDRARQQCRLFHMSFRSEVARLVIHGTLHLLGYDDKTDRLARLMKGKEDRYVAYWFPEGRVNKE